ncbi:hypothetical protein [Haladaptatus sp. DYF46]|uniref:hypothetical protein n=1 Tax=Haladaptatus sp. DYF46 TaxID=2886041 RepID=UPI001E410F56|nr:hypothetical protein [Haladaptatus sp. DYF46]
MFRENRTKRAHVWVGLYAGLVGTPDDRTETEDERSEDAGERAEDWRDRPGNE